MRLKFDWYGAWIWMNDETYRLCVTEGVLGYRNILLPPQAIQLNKHP
jgi:hypothetical protein